MQYSQNFLISANKLIKTWLIKLCPFLIICTDYHWNMMFCYVRTKKTFINDVFYVVLLLFRVYL